MPLISVDKNVPIPPPIRGNRAYPWHAMTDVGDSFFVPVAGSTLSTIRARIHCSMRAMRKTDTPEATWEYTTRHVDGGIRVWRTK